MKLNVGVVIVCAGAGKRLGRRDKAVIRLGGEPLFCKAVKAFKDVKPVKQIALVLRKKNFSLAKKFSKDKRVVLVEGGSQRRDSVSRGLAALNKEIDYVLIHDGARPFVKKRVILDILKELRKHPAVISAIQSSDTVKLTKGKYISKTLQRENLYFAQTPQGFRKDLLLKAYANSRRKFTDSAQAVELLGKKVKVVEGDLLNLKVTYPRDLALAQMRSGSCPHRVGFGFDVHRISKKKKDLILGGVKIACSFSLEAVSDGDVVLHAVSDALCGVGCLGDIGDYFPPQDKKSKDISSRKIVKLILKKIGSKFNIANIDVIIVTDKPRLLGHKKDILKSLKSIFKVSAVNLKVKSKEKTDILGGRNAISCFVSVLAERKCYK